MATEREAQDMTPAMRRMIEQTGAVEVAARIGGNLPAPIGDSDRYAAEWVARLLCIGYGVKTPALAAADIVKLDPVPRDLDRTEKFIRALGVMVCFDSLGWSRARTGEAWGIAEGKARNCAKRGREWAAEPNVAAAAQVVAGHVQRRLAPDRIGGAVFQHVETGDAKKSRAAGNFVHAKKSRDAGVAKPAAE